MVTLFLPIGVSGIIYSLVNSDCENCKPSVWGGFFLNLGVRPFFFCKDKPTFDLIKHDDVPPANKTILTPNVRFRSTSRRIDPELSKSDSNPSFQASQGWSTSLKAPQL